MRSSHVASPSKRIAARASQAEQEAAAAASSSSSSAAAHADDDADDVLVADYLAALSPGSPDKNHRRGGATAQGFLFVLFL
jgi:DnaJ-domain-containing protein 1